MMDSIIDEDVVRGFQISGDGRHDALAFGRLFATESVFRPEEVQCREFPPDGVKVILTHGRRRLTMYFMGDGRFVFGKTIVGGGRAGEGETSIDHLHRPQRLDLYGWLSGQPQPAAEARADGPLA